MSDKIDDEPNMLLVFAMIMFGLAFISYVSSDNIVNRSTYNDFDFDNYDLSSYSTSDMFYIDDDLFLIVANNDNTYSGFKWNESEWQSNPNIVQGIKW